MEGSAARAAASALAVLDALGDAEGRNIYDPELRQALAPLATLPALEVGCGRCRKRLAWWALDDRAGAFVAATERRAKPKRRSGGMNDLASPLPRRNMGLAPWIELAETANTSVHLVDWNNPAGYPLRLKFTCHNCSADNTLTNTNRLRRYLTAIARGSGTVFL